MPPLDEIFKAFWQALLVPCAVSAVCFLIVARFVPRISALGALIAVALGFLAGNNLRDDVIKFRLNSDRPIEVVEVAKVGYHALLNEGPMPSARYWLPWLALLAGVLGLLARLPMPGLVAWLLRASGAAIASRLLVPPDLRAQTAWLWPALAAAMFAVWLTLESLSRFDPGPGLPFGVAFAFLAAAAVILHAHTGSFAEIAAIAGGCWLGLAFVCWRRGCDAGGAAPLAAVLLPGLIFIAQQSTSSEVPLKSFLLVGLAPLAFLPVWLLRIFGFHSRRWLLLGWLLLLGAEGWAVRLAMQAESLMGE